MPSINHLLMHMDKQNDIKLVKIECCSSILSIVFFKHICATEVKKTLKKAVKKTKALILIKV